MFVAKHRRRHPLQGDEIGLELEHTGQFRS